MLGYLPATFRFLEFFHFFPDFFHPNLFIFEPKVEKKKIWMFFPLNLCTTDLNFGTKNVGRTKLSSKKMMIFANCCGPEVVRSSCYSKNIGAKFIHLYIPSLCKEFFVMRHNLGHYCRYLHNQKRTLACFICNGKFYL